MDPTADTVESLILDLLEWITTGNRTYEEAIDAWRTSCPRLPAWEDPHDRGLITVERSRPDLLRPLHSLGNALLNQRRPVTEPRP